MLSESAKSAQANLPARVEAVVIGASAGAINALGVLLPAFPAQTPFPVIVVVHLPANHPSLLPSLFARRCALRVLEPLDKQPISAGIWFAPPDYHLLVETSGVFSMSIDAPVNHSRPSVDVLFESAAAVYGEALIGIVLTGANSDGANGAKAIRDAGGFVIVQAPETADVRAMPEAAIARAHPQWVAPLLEIAEVLALAARAGSP